MIQLENEFLNVSIKPEGAELQRIQHRQFNIDYLWGGDPEYWGKHAPVLFPIVGTLKENTYYFEGRPYNLSRHGFARDMKFNVISHNQTAAKLELKSTELTRQAYPFEFTLHIEYLLQENKLINRYEVINSGKRTMYFSIGGHPAFNVPMQEGLVYADYYLVFDHMETAPRWPLHEGLLKTHPDNFLVDDNKIHLNQNLFIQDAIVLKHLKSKTVSLKSNASKHGLKMNIEGFPYLGIWAAPKAPFVCVEPWCGVTDSLYHNQQLTAKEGIISLEPGESWNNAWDVTFF